MKKGKRNGLFRHHEPVKCVIEPLKWRWFALCGKSINNDLISVIIKYELNSIGNKAKDDDLYTRKCATSMREFVLEMRDLGQEPKHIVIAGVLRTSLANRKIQRYAAHRGGYGESHSCAFRALIPYAAGQEITKRITALTAMSRW